MATRRSPRSIGRFCNGLSFEGCTTEQTALLLSLAQCTGWSADRICLKLKEIVRTGVPFKAEDVWNFHWRWILSRGGSDVASVGDTDIMKLLMKDAGVELAVMGNPLNRTVQPKTIQFRPQWSPKNDDGLPLIAHFTAVNRNNSKSWLARQKKSAFGKPSPAEEEAVNNFGSTLALIIKDILRRWARAMRVKLRIEPRLRPIREREHVILIMEYLGIFQDAFETVFGLMEHTKPSALGHIKHDTVYIRSTGYAAKVFLGLLMADRLHVIERQRQEERERIGFVQVEVESLEEDCKNCPICQDPMGFESPEGTKETPMKLIVCCGQVIGESCMKAWLNEFVSADVQRNSCPVCRFVFPTSFLEKLFGNGEDGNLYANGEVDGGDKDVINLVTPTPSPERVVPREPARIVFINSVHQEDARLEIQFGDAEDGDYDDFVMEG